MNSVMGFVAGSSMNIGPIIWILLMYMHKESRIWLLIWENKIIWMIPR
mgnify:CR=1 FL=1